MEEIMGCDIHLHIEVKLFNKWEHYSCPNILRNYKLFAKMAGVRNDVDTPIEPISKPKGLEYLDDLTTITKFNLDRWKGDAHSCSWLNKEEIAELSAWLLQLEGSRMDNDLEWGFLKCYLFGNSFGGIVNYPEDVPPGVSDVRFIFWFDN